MHCHNSKEKILLKTNNGIFRVVLNGSFGSRTGISDYLKNVLGNGKLPEKNYIYLFSLSHIATISKEKNGIL